MIKFFGSIDPFWINDLTGFVFPHRSGAGQRDYFHPNYSKQSNDLPQAFDQDIPNASEYFKKLNLSLGTISWTCIEPGQVIPIHTDGFYKLKTQYDADIKDCVRYLIFLEDWVFGHVVEFETITITKWQQGDVWMFDHEPLHFAANASNINFVTCQVNTIVNI